MKYIFSIIASLFFSSAYTQNVSLVWAKSIGGTSNLVADRSMWVDASGNVYTIGFFNPGTADFDPGPGVYNLTSVGSSNIFVSKLDVSGNFVWAKSMGGTSGGSIGRGIIVDAAGNVFISGFFQGTVDFDPGPGVYNLVSAGFDDIFISKLDASGNFVWAKSMGGTSTLDWSLSVTVDASGNVYSTGQFQGTADFDPGPGVYNLVSSGGVDFYISKLDPSGNFLWAAKIGDVSSEFGLFISVDASDNVYATGTFTGTGDFDPGPGVYNLTSNGGQDIFISKIDPSGNLVWAKNMGGVSVSDADWGESIAIDVSGNVYISGRFGATGDFDPGPGVYNLTSAGGNDIFVSKLDVSGNFVWAKNMGGTSNDLQPSISVDAFGNVYTTGEFLGTGDFDPGPGIYNLTSAGVFDIFISKLDASGNFLWAKNMGGDASDEGRSIIADAIGNLYIAGNFSSSTVDFDPGPGTYNITRIGSTTDMFILKLSSAIWNGGISNVWSNPANWDSGLVPDINSDVVIPSGLAIYPTVFSSTEIGSLFLQSGAAITVNTGSNLMVRNSLPYVTIFNQTWMLKNLDVATYKNGDPIPKVTDPTAWAGLTTGAYCYYNNDSAAYAATYGKLYNWYAVNDPRGLAPQGWHIPTDAEWTTLTTNLSGETIAGDKLKEAGLAHWVSPNDADNSSGFTALPGGGRLNTGPPNSLTGERGYWWSSTEQTTTNAWLRALVFGTSNVFRTAINKKSGYSIRCIKD